MQLTERQIIYLERRLEALALNAEAIHKRAQFITRKPLPGYLNHLKDKMALLNIELIENF